MATDYSSDLPYVRGDGRNIMSQPVFPVGMVNWTDKSRLSGPAGTPFTLFEKASENDTTVTSRWMAHVGTKGSIWVNMLGGEAGVNSPGSFELMAGDTPVFLPTRGRVRVWATIADIPITAAEG